MRHGSYWRVQCARRATGQKRWRYHDYGERKWHEPMPLALQPMQLAPLHGATLVAMMGVTCTTCARDGARCAEVSATDCAGRFR